MTIHNDTLMRQWQILRLIPRYPQRRTATEIHHSLYNDNQAVSKRTVERDLVALSALFPIVTDESEKPYGWSWAKDAPAIDIPAMTDAEAITFKLLELHLGHLLPPSYREKLGPYFAVAEQRLSAEFGERLTGSLADKIRVVQPRRGLIPATIRSGVQDAVLEALLKQRQLRVSYARHILEVPQALTLSPCAVVQFWGHTSLVASPDGRTVEVFRLHRMLQAEVLPESALIPAGFDIDQFLFPRAFGMRAGNGVVFRGMCTPEAANALLDRPIGLNQRIVIEGDNHAWVEASVPPEAKVYLEEVERESGLISDFDVTLYHGRFWGEGQPVSPIGGFDG